jgi:hypothetical protein
MFQEMALLEVIGCHLSLNASETNLVMIVGQHNSRVNSRVQHSVARISIGFTNVYYHRTQLSSLSLSLF